MNKFNSNSSNKFGYIDNKIQFLNIIHQETIKLLETTTEETIITDEKINQEHENINDILIINNNMIIEQAIERYPDIEQPNTTTSENDTIVEYLDIYQTKSDNDTEIIYYDATQPKLKTVVDIIAKKNKLDIILNKKKWK
jgi:hypothetical protein